jgi:predicted Rossmann fold flavoprotein
LGAEGDGYTMAELVGHTVTDLYPAMMPLKTKETWVGNCRADTIAKVTMQVDMKKYKKLSAVGDLIFTKDGIRGPVVLDFSREITPLLSKFDEVPVLVNLTKGMNEEQIREHFKQEIVQDPHRNTLQLLLTLLPESVSLELCKLAEVDPALSLGKQVGSARDKLIKLLAWTPLTINGHEGFKMAMITRGGIHLKEIDPYTMQSKKLKGLYFCGEVMNIDGPCGGYNLQWSFASGYVAGMLKT